MGKWKFFSLCALIFIPILNLVVLQVADNLNTLVVEQPMEESLDVCLSSLYLCLIKQEDEKILSRVLYTTRKAFFMHELKNDSKNWVRRICYYNALLQVLKNSDSPKFLEFVGKNAPKDRKQSQIEDLAAQVQLLCEKSVIQD